METYPDLRCALRSNPSGVAFEFGVAGGWSARLIAAQMPLIGFDSWKGLPEDWRDHHVAGSMACDIPEIDNAMFIPGWFEDTLPDFPFDQYDIGLVHIDCDLYSSTKTVFTHIGPHLRAGCRIVLDDYTPGDPYVAQAWVEAAEQFDWDVVKLRDAAFILK